MGWEAQKHLVSRCGWFSGRGSGMTRVTRCWMREIRWQYVFFIRYIWFSMMVHSCVWMVRGGGLEGSGQSNPLQPALLSFRSCE
jgi:hypothetical protein